MSLLQPISTLIKQFSELAIRKLLKIKRQKLKSLEIDFAVGELRENGFSTGEERELYGGERVVWGWGWWRERKKWKLPWEWSGGRRDRLWPATLAVNPAAAGMVDWVGHMDVGGGNRRRWLLSREGDGLVGW